MPAYKRLVVLLAAILVVSSLFLIFTSGNEEWSPYQDDVGGHTYIIHRDGMLTQAIDPTTGAVEYSSTDSGKVIQDAIDAMPQGGGILIKEGDYHLSQSVEVKSNIQLLGEGPGTIFRGALSFSFLIEEQTNVTIGNFSLLGNGGILIAGYDAPSRGILVKDIDATIGPASEGVFYTLALDATVSDVSFVRCNALDCGTNGFINNGRSEKGWVENIAYIDCKAIGCGRNSRYNDWIVGFDLAEQVNVRNMRVTDCEASNNWQSGFHFELLPELTNVVLERCVANDNGQAKGHPEGEGYGWGYLIYMDWPKHDIRLYDCTASGNWRGETNLGPL